MAVVKTYSQKRAKCSICFKIFGAKATLKRHIELFHESENTASTHEKKIGGSVQFA